MRATTKMLMLFGGISLALGAAAWADVTVKVEGVHLCCGGCAKAATAAIEKSGSTATCEQAAGTVTITAADTKAARKAVRALARAGFGGTPDDTKAALKEEMELPAGKVTSLKLTGVHNCCGSCAKAIKEAVSAVEGVTGDTLEAKAKAFEVTGNFEAKAVMEALSAAGFHAHLAK